MFLSNFYIIILFLLFQTTWSHCLILSDQLSTLFTIFFFKRLTQNSIFDDTGRIFIPVLSDIWKLTFALFLALMYSYHYGVTYIQLTSFHLSIMFSNTISTDFVSITSKKVSLFLIFYTNLCLWIDCFIISKKHEIIVWVIMTICTHYL